MDINALYNKINQRFAARIQAYQIACGELTIEIARNEIREICRILRDEEDFDFKMLIDVCGVDYLHYGVDEWQKESTTETGFSRGVDTTQLERQWTRSRFAVVYHLLSLSHNHRLRIRVLLDENQPAIDSVIEIWPAANWFEREAFDLYGILFVDHPDLRRILTDYGFIGHPFRKDFPLSGNVEVRYDAALGRVIYEPVDIERRILEPKVIRHDNRYRKEITGNGKTS